MNLSQFGIILAQITPLWRDRLAAWNCRSSLSCDKHSNSGTFRHFRHRTFRHKTFTHKIFRPACPFTAGFPRQLARTALAPVPLCLLSSPGSAWHTTLDQSEGLESANQPTGSRGEVSARRGMSTLIRAAVAWGMMDYVCGFVSLDELNWWSTRIVKLAMV